jgi:hypothetical protein
MKVNTKFLNFIILLALLILPTSNVYAQSPGGDVVLFGQNYTLKSGEALNGSLAVIGGNATIEEDAHLNGGVVLVGGNLKLLGAAIGDVALIGGNLTISGKVTGDVVIVGGQVKLTDTAVVDGNLTTIGGQLDRDPKAQVTGNVTTNAPPIKVPNVPNVPSGPTVPTPPQKVFPINPLWNVANVMFQALAVAALGMLLSLFFQPQFERVGDAIIRQPILAGSFGLILVAVTPLILLIMIITLILIPVALIVVLMIPLAWLFGVIALGQEVGDRFTKAINQTWAPVISTGCGTFLLMLLGGLFGLVPCVGWLVPFLVALMGMGGVAMTWFGTRSAPGAQSQGVEVPPASAS